MTQPYRTALIVGAGRGLSASLARAFARSGMRVALAARDAAKLDALCSETGATAFACDAQEPSQVTRLFDALEAKLGAPDVSSTTPVDACGVRSPPSPPTMSGVR